MKKTALYVALFSLFVVLTSTIEDTNYDTKALKKELIQELKPDYKYDSSNINHFELKSETQGAEIQVPIFSNEKYRLLFNTAEFSSDFEIKIYNKKQGSKNRKILYAVKGSETDQHVFIFEPENAKTMYIEYTIPSTEEKGVKGCIVFLMGYKIG